MTKADYELVAKTLRAHFNAHMPFSTGPVEAKANDMAEIAQETYLALGLAFEEEIEKSFDLTQFLKECEP